METRSRIQWVIYRILVAVHHFFPSNNTKLYRTIKNGWFTVAVQEPINTVDDNDMAL